MSGELDLSLYEMLDDANWWLLGVDFWEHSHELFEKFSDAYIINDLPTPSGTALPYEDVHIHDLQELKEFLLTPEQSVICYTKNPGAIERFLQENEIKEVEVHELRKLPGESFVWTSVQTGL